MSMYVVNVSRPTRRGGEVILTRYISTEMHQYDLRKKLEGIYKGLLLTITEPDNWEEIPIESEKEMSKVEVEVKVKEEPLKKIFTIRDKDIVLTDDEKLLYQVYVDAVKHTREARNKLKSTIITRLKKLNWVKDIQDERIVLDTYQVKNWVRVEIIELKDTIVQIYENELGVKNEEE